MLSDLLRTYGTTIGPVGVPMSDVRVVTGDTDATPYGGGTWACRAAGIGGEAAWQSGKALH